MLEKVQELKSLAVNALISGSEIEKQNIDEIIDRFMASNRFRILDILDDALSRSE
jgi:hypothetical protein